MHDSGRDFELAIYAAFGVAAGVGLFFKGFKNFKLKKLIEDLPTSNIRSLPMGLVEIIGRAVKTVEMCTPFSNTPCVFFQYVIERLRKTRRGSYWDAIKRYSSPIPFEVSDDTGSILINPSEAEVEVESMNRYSNDSFNSLPANAVKFMDMNGINYTGFFGSKHTLRLTEYFIRPGGQVYVIGTARHAGDLLEKSPEYSSSIDRKRYMLAETLKNLKSSPILLKKYDSNKDGKIDSVEWDKARDDVARWVDYKMTDDSLKRMKDIKLEIGKGKHHPLLICDRDEWEICSKLTWKSSGYIFGGALLTIACIVFLIFYLPFVFK